MIESAFWGFVAASSLVIGAEIAFRFDLGRVTVGLIMAFGVGSLVSSISFELVAPALRDYGEIWIVSIMLLVGSAVFFIGDRFVSGMGGEHRKDLRKAPPTPPGERSEGASGRGIALGTVLDGIPESAVLGISIASGGMVSVALLVAIWISNLPESLGSSAGLVASGVPKGRIRLLWWVIVLVSSAAAGIGYLFMVGSDARTGVGLQAFAAGALLTMIVDELAPEAFHRSALYAGLAATTGFVLTLFLIGLD
jgi:ZIP family zinc transporter